MASTTNCAFRCPHQVSHLTESLCRPSPFRLPRLATPFNDHASNTTKTPVSTSFHHFLTSLGVPPSRLEPFLHSLGSYDFSASSNVQLVHSHRGSSWSSHPQQTLNFGPSTSKGRCRRKALSRSNEAEASPGSLSRSMPSAPLPAEPGPSKPSSVLVLLRLAPRQHPRRDRLSALCLANSSNFSSQLAAASLRASMPETAIPSSASSRSRSSSLPRRRWRR